MLGELLYHLHRHVRLVLVVSGLSFLIGAVALGYEVVRHLEGPSARPAKAERA